MELQRKFSAFLNRLLVLLVKVAIPTLVVNRSRLTRARAISIISRNIPSSVIPHLPHASLLPPEAVVPDQLLVAHSDTGAVKAVAARALNGVVVVSGMVQVVDRLAVVINWVNFRAPTLRIRRMERRVLRPGRTISRWADLLMSELGSNHSRTTHHQLSSLTIHSHIRLSMDLSSLVLGLLIGHSDDYN
jgi:hypothetical protein